MIDPTQDPNSFYYQGDGSQQGSFAPPAPSAPPAYTPNTFTPNQTTINNQGAIPPGSIAGTANNNSADLSTYTDQQHLSSLLASYPNNPQQAIAIFNQNFPNSPLKPSLSHDNTIGLSNGTYLVAPNTGGNNAGTWQVVPRSGNDTGGNPGGGFAIDPSYLAPFTGQFQSPGQANIPDFGGFSSFTQPTGADVQADPSYQFRFDQAMQGMTNNKAAQGLFNSGGTLYDLGNLASNFASEDYSNVWNRDYNLWNQDNSNKLAAFGANQGTSNEAYNRAWQQYLNQQQTYYSNQTNPFNKLMSAAQLGVGAATTAG